MAFWIAMLKLWRYWLLINNKISKLTNSKILQESFQFEIWKYMLIYMRKVFFEFAPVYYIIYLTDCLP